MASLERIGAVDQVLGSIPPRPNVCVRVRPVGDAAPAELEFVLMVHSHLATAGTSFATAMRCSRMA
jgi:hypothetical protein